MAINQLNTTDMIRIMGTLMLDQVSILLMTVISRVRVLIIPSSKMEANISIINLRDIMEAINSGQGKDKSSTRGRIIK